MDGSQRFYARLDKSTGRNYYINVETKVRGAPFSSVQPAAPHRTQSEPVDRKRLHAHRCRRGVVLSLLMMWWCSYHQATTWTLPPGAELVARPKSKRQQRTQSKRVQAQPQAQPRAQAERPQRTAAATQPASQQRGGGLGGSHQHGSAHLCLRSHESFVPAK